MMALLLADRVPRQIRYVGVENPSTRYAPRAAPPVCMVLCLGCLNHPGKIAQYSATLPRIQAFDTILLFEPPSH